MKVTLVAKTFVNEDYILDVLPHDGETASVAEVLTEFAGRACYESWSRPNPATAKTADYVRSIIEKKHFSVLEHASVTFFIEGVSRNLTHELIRHRHLSFSQLSQRFCDESEREFVVPPALRDAFPDAPESAPGEVMAEPREHYREVVETLLGRGLTRKQAREAARFILPSGTETKIVVTGNHRAWYEMLVKRLSPQADAEIRELAQELLRQLKEIAPTVYETLDENGLVEEKDEAEEYRADYWKQQALAAEAELEEARQRLDELDIQNENQG